MAIDYENLTDEEMENLDPNNMPDELGDDSEENDVSESADDSDHTDEDTDQESEEDDESSDDDSDEELDDTDNAEEHSESDDDDEPDSEVDSQQEEQTSSTAEVDYEAVYKQVFGPVKANGKLIQVQTPEDAVRLIQMGANYNLNMHEMKPHRKLIKTLESKGLLGEDRINTFIDAMQGNKDALKEIAKLAQIDVNELSGYDEDEAPKYVPTNHIVTDTQVALTDVLDEIRNTPTYDKLLDTVSGKWSDASREAINKNPEILKTLNSHMESGDYEIIENAMDNMRALGTYPSHLPEVEVYGRLYGDYQASAKNREAPQSTAQATGTPPQKSAPKTNGNKMAPTRKSKGSTRKTMSDADLLSLPDDQFEEMANKLLYATL